MISYNRHVLVESHQQSTEKDEKISILIAIKIGMENQYNSNVFFYKLFSDFIPSSVQNG